MTIVMIGGAVAEKIGKVIKNTFDNVDVICYNTLDKFCEETGARDMFFERMFITPDLFDNPVEHEEEMIALEDYINKKFPEVRVISFAKTSEAHEMNSSIFTSPIQLNILLDKLTPSKVEELVSTPIEVLRHRYAKDTEADAVIVKGGKKESKPKQKPAKKEKKGFFGFGKKQKKKEQVEYVLDEDEKGINNNTPEKELENSSAQENDDTYANKTMDNEGFGEEFQNEAPEIEGNFESKNDVYGNKSDDEVQHKRIKPKARSISSNDIAENLQNSNSEIVNDIEEATGEVFDFVEEEDNTEENKVGEARDIKEEVREVDSDIKEIVEAPIDESIAEVTKVETVVDRVNDMEDTLSSEDEDEEEFAAQGISFDDINQMEESYQTDVGNTRVIEKVIEKEKVVEVEKVVEKPIYIKGSKKNASKLQLVTKGLENIALIVTGDRRSGVTTTATKIATMFAQKLKVLYVDMDTDRRGSLVYIGINELASEDDIVQRGLELLKNDKMLVNMVYKSNAVKFDSLVSIGEDKVSDEQLEKVGDILMLQEIYNVVVIDCPLDKLHLLKDMISVSNVVVCLEEDAGAIKNTSTFLESIDLPTKHKRTLYNNMNYCMTRGAANKFPMLFKQVNELFETDDGVNWADVKKVAGSANELVKLMENVLG